MARRRARPASLLAALFGRMGALMLLVVLMVAFLAFFTAQRRINEIYDGQLIIGANVLRALMSEELRAAPAPGGGAALQVDDALLSPEDRQAFDNYADWRMFRIWRGEALALGSDTGPAIARPPPRDGFSHVDDAEGRWRIYALHVPANRVTVVVGERLDIRLVLMESIAVRLAAPLLLLAPLAAILTWVALRSGLRAIQTLNWEIGRRTMRDLSPLPVERWPKDLHSLIDSINRLFGRIDLALENERRFLDGAAHQLRTPLAVVKLQAQLIGSEDDPVERRIMCLELSESVDRASAMTDRLLTLARLEAQRATSDAQVDLRAEAIAAITDLAAVAARRHVELSFAGEPAAMKGDPLLLRLIVSNLVENAVNHAPEGSEVAVTVSSVPGTHRLVVTDAGPGIPAAERALVTQRFYRGLGEGTISGTGLGLSIVTEALNILGGRLELVDRADGRRGLSAVAELPAPFQA